MVTIEQKLTLFSKLLNQDIKEDLENRARELEEEYEKKLSEHKVKIDQQAKEIIDIATKRGEVKKIELISKGKMILKKEEMFAKEEATKLFIESLTKRVEAFTKEPAYKIYMTNLISSLTELKSFGSHLVIYMTSKDEANSSWIKEAFMSLGFTDTQIEFKATTEDIIGGVIIEEPNKNLRIDYSLSSHIDEAKDYIVEMITKRLGEVGDLT